MALLIDTGPLYASIDRSDPKHGAVVDVLRSSPRPHVIPEPVLVEIDYWIRKLLDVSVLRALVADITAGRYRLEPVTESDLDRIVELETRYGDADLGFVDASIVAAAERLSISHVLTFDRRHFAMVVPKHVHSFVIEPSST